MLLAFGKYRHPKQHVEDQQKTIILVTLRLFISVGVP